MVYLIVTTKYPTHKATEVAKRYFEVLSKYPVDESLEEELVPAAVNTTLEGITVLAISMVKKGKLDEARARSLNSMAMFNEIEGFEYKIEIWSTVEEALATIGMKMP